MFCSIGPGSSATSFYRSNSSFLLDPGSSAFRLFGYKVPALWQLRRFNILAPFFFSFFLFFRSLTLC
ncbi:unnamed protein product [Rhizophagus irregularis]|nr:hypothetical protein RhiirB3_264015 [Rhizophagus irregularis]CAB5201596.1 unnamed protein product [Rhizophagus irregularis]